MKFAGASTRRFALFISGYESPRKKGPVAVITASSVQVVQANTARTFLKIAAVSVRAEKMARVKVFFF